MPRAILLLACIAGSVALPAGFVACANGDSNGSTSSDGGDDSTLSADGQPLGDGGGSESSKPPGDGSGTSLTTACSDNAAQYCTQLSTCSPFLLAVWYGDTATCTTRLGNPYCADIVNAKGSGWTGDGLEACIAARQKLSCTDFLYAKPGPAACRPTGSIVNGTGGCVFSTQCGSGYCRVPAGATCGTCEALAVSSGLCVTSNDCDVNLLCSMGTCVAPLPVGGVCAGTMTPCANGLRCIAGKCAQPGPVGTACDVDAGGTECDYNLGAYCSGGTCAAITQQMSTAACDGVTEVCVQDGFCQTGFCVPPTTDGTACGGDSGAAPCTIPEACIGGTCALPTSADCP